MCQLGVEQALPSAPTRWQEQPNIPDAEPLAGTNRDTEVRSFPPKHHHPPKFVVDPCMSSDLSMASSNNASQQPDSQYSQSFHAQSTQDASTEVASSTRPTSDVNTLVGGATTSPKLEGTAKHNPVAESIALSEENLQHRLNASGSVQAIVVDDDVLFAGLQGGDIVVSTKFVFASFVVLSTTGLVA